MTPCQRSWQGHVPSSCSAPRTVRRQLRPALPALCADTSAPRSPHFPPAQLAEFHTPLLLLLLLTNALPAQLAGLRPFAV